MSTPPAESWTMTRAAAAVHQHVLGPAGYRRKGLRCSREDFLVREVSFHADPYREKHERATQPAFELMWPADPAGLPVVGRMNVGVGLAAGPFDLPPSDVDEPPAALLEHVAAYGLPFLELGTSPQEFIDLLLDVTPLEPVGTENMYGESVHLHMAAYGALLHDQRSRFARAVRLSIENLTRFDPEFHVTAHVRQELTDLVAAADQRRGWRVAVQ